MDENQFQPTPPTLPQEGLILLDESYTQEGSQKFCTRVWVDAEGTEVVRESFRVMQ